MEWGALKATNQDRSITGGFNIGPRVRETTAPGSVGFLQTTLEPHILPAASFCASIYNRKSVFLKLESVPSNATEEDIRGFFTGIDIEEVLFQFYDHGGTKMVFVKVPENNVPEFEALAKDKAFWGEQTISVEKELNDDNRQMIDELQREKELQEAQICPSQFLYFKIEPVDLTTTEEDVRKFFAGVDIKEVLLELDNVYFGRVYIKASDASAATVLAYDGEFIGDRCVTVKINHKNQVYDIAALHARKRRKEILTGEGENDMTYIALGRIPKSTKLSEVEDFIGKFFIPIHTMQVKKNIFSITFVLAGVFVVCLY
ncbi:hypothetical protein KP79_PYT12826 [Mizuhopecten yessoensis]|uniref:RRM domain-containing protein n=1 Tax=Mizuhopecten yessoensis TaxID=6573 RepID=A0A210PNK2_MIZYE|nr:hypothetical protein KP79_PYT12826 [Mizuhopecten yessoensis]